MRHPLYLQKLAPISPKIGGRLVGIHVVRLWTKRLLFVFTASDEFVLS
jgi:hypothetical protein